MSTFRTDRSKFPPFRIDVEALHYYLCEYAGNNNYAYPTLEQVNAAALILNGEVTDASS